MGPSLDVMSLGLCTEHMYVTLVGTVLAHCLLLRRLQLPVIDGHGTCSRPASSALVYLLMSS